MLTNAYDGLAQVGFAEIGIPGVGAGRRDAAPADRPAQQAGPRRSRHALYILMTRSRAIEPPRHDPEPTDGPDLRLADGPQVRRQRHRRDQRRRLRLPDQPAGRAHPDTAALPSGAGPGPAVVVAANSSTRLDEDRQARANAAVDGNPATAWIAETGPQAGEWLSYTLNKPITIDHLDLQLVNDGRHSLPTRITISTASGSQVVDLPRIPVGYGRAQGSTTTVPVSFPAVTGSHVKFTIDAVDQVQALDYYSTFTPTTDILPVGIAELGLPVVQPAPPVPAPGDVPIRPAAHRRPAGRRRDHRLHQRRPGRQQPLTPGVRQRRRRHRAERRATSWCKPVRRLPSGWSIDTLAMASDPGGPAALGPLPAAATPPAGAVHVTPPPLHLDHQNRTSWTVTVDGNGNPFWLVLGQSQSAGWSANLPGGHSLGPSQLIDGYANGWYVPAGTVNGPTVIHLTWTPQRVVWAALGCVRSRPRDEHRGRAVARRRHPPEAPRRVAPTRRAPAGSPLPVSWAAVCRR